jgi:serine/threonine protein kinase
MELERLGKYELLERLGQGGMGEVWKARDTQLQRFVAIKLLHADLQAQPDFVAHFMREARFVASLRHPNIVQVHDFQSASVEGSRVRAYMVMDYIEGGTLADYMRGTVRRGVFPPASDIVNLFAAISQALDYAHQKGMVHRDIKPGNILLDRPAGSKGMGEPILTDFGIARLQDAGASTVSHALVGTPLYISPEQAEGRTVDTRSDLYSLGVVLYEMLSGEPPFRGDNPLAVMMKHVHEQPRPPALINPRITPALSAVVLQSIAKKPEDRFASATAMTMALAGAFNLPLPPGLSSTRGINAGQGYNPLQPSRSPHGIITAPPPALTASPTFTQPAAITASSAGRYASQDGISPSSMTPTLPSSPSAPTPQVQPAPRTTPPPSRRRWLFVALIACVLLALVGVSAFKVVPLLSPAHVTPTPTATGGVVGHITFSRSASAPSNTFDQLRIDLSNIPSPPSGMVYYAWLEDSNGEASTYPNWQLHVSNGAVHGLYSSPSPQKDLFAGSNWFLVTAETVNSSPPIPNPTESMHFYYARITHSSTSSPVFEVQQCPSGSAANSIIACR